MWVKAPHQQAVSKQVFVSWGSETCALCDKEKKASGVMCFSVCVHEKYRTSFVQRGKPVPTQPLLLLGGTDAEHWNLDSPSHLLNAAAFSSISFSLVSMHTPGDRHNALFHRRITNRMKYFANFIKKVLKMKPLLSFTSATSIKNLQVSTPF